MIPYQILTWPLHYKSDAWTPFLAKKTNGMNGTAQYMFPTMKKYQDVSEAGDGNVLKELRLTQLSTNLKTNEYQNNLSGNSNET